MLGSNQQSPQISWRVEIMRTVVLAFVLLSVSLAWCQNEPENPSNAATPADNANPAPQTAKPDSKKREEDRQPLPDSARSVPPAAAVLTVKGLCPGNEPQPKTAAVCQTIITRAQFEALTDAIRPDMPPTTQRQLAASYPRLLAMAHEAEQRGLDKKAHYQEMIAFARLQILAQDLVHEIEDQAADLSEKDIQDYYRSNAASFERANLERITVPDIRQNRPNPNAASEVQSKASDTGADKEAMKMESDALRARAAAGEDFGKLQKEAYDFAGLTTPPPSTTLQKVRRSGLPSTQAFVFDLKPGEVSPVIAEGGGFYIYKVVLKETEPLSEAENEIRKTLTVQRSRAMMQKVQESVTTEMNPAYFGSPAWKRHATSKGTPAPGDASQANGPTENPK